MCGRYSLALRPAQIRQMLQDDDMSVDETPDDEGDETPRQSYNFAPSYHGIVYRADVPDWGAGPRRHHENATPDKVAAEEHAEWEAAGDASSAHPVSYKLQSMKWGLVPFWTKRSPDRGSTMKTINCRDDSLAQGGGMWSTMKARKRCIVVAQGFYEWLNKGGGREKIPHYVKRKDGKLMCFAGLWDVVQYEDGGQKLYTYTIITTSSNKQLSFLHDRMPVILDNGSEAMRTWLDPARYEWSKELQALLKPFDGELDVYRVSKDVGKVGNDSPTFVVPIDSKENKASIANFFASKADSQLKPQVEVKKEEEEKESLAATTGDAACAEERMDEEAEGKEASTGIKREAEGEPAHGAAPSPKKVATTTPTKSTPSPRKGSGRKIGTAATVNNTNKAKKSPSKTKQVADSQKITSFFGKKS
ncbi:DUF159-domain-containing protein [Durotheca rogersii]|uniref:DUF159-domain-containing protein n=1 Tax=Durotheca rogersii TaxID=419775 RepID=UPI002220988A|nr:DUF159-domain-containing protein [Durotheca rogersii]KAI5860130.1 DUF159-domain-containing protein [Durotheca rogersii]